MSGIVLRYLQVVIVANDHQHLPGARFLKSFSRMEFLTNLNDRDSDMMRCLVKVRHAHPGALTDEIEALKINNVLETSGEESLLDITMNGPIPQLFASFVGVWWATPTVLEAGVLHLTVRGQRDNLKAARRSMDELLGSRYTLTTVSTGLKNPKVLRSLSNRQTEVLGAALDLGYYRRPRTCTQRDLAKFLGVSQATVSEHLQAAEAKVIQNAYHDELRAKDAEGKDPVH